MFIVGSKTSSNTKKLFEICSKISKNVYYIQSKSDVKKEFLHDVTKVGISGGASTPVWLINEVKDKIYSLEH